MKISKKERELFLIMGIIFIILLIFKPFSQSIVKPSGSANQLCSYGDGYRCSINWEANDGSVNSIILDNPHIDIIEKGYDSCRFEGSLNARSCGCGPGSGRYDPSCCGPSSKWSGTTQGSPSISASSISCSLGLSVLVEGGQPAQLSGTLIFYKKPVVIPTPVLAEPIVTQPSTQSVVTQPLTFLEKLKTDFQEIINWIKMFILIPFLPP